MNCVEKYMSVFMLIFCVKKEEHQGVPHLSVAVSNALREANNKLNWVNQTTCIENYLLLPGTKFGTLSYYPVMLTHEGHTPGW